MDRYWYPQRLRQRLWQLVPGFKKPLTTLKLVFQSRTNSYHFSRKNRVFPDRYVRIAALPQGTQIYL